MIQTYFGNGKGKTTASVGAAVRYAGSGKQVLFVQFLKNHDSSELKVLESIQGVRVLSSKEPYHLFDNLKEERTARLALAYQTLLLEEIPQYMVECQMLVLDEVLDAVSFGYIEESQLFNFLSELRADKEIVLTGHRLIETIAGISDYISEIKAVSHPYTKGVLPREGIEF